MIGQRLAHYQISAKLGEGGMGAVYQATDTKLNREVAIKVLPPEVAQDPERLARFKREAQLLARSCALDTRSCAFEDRSLRRRRPPCSRVACLIELT